MLLRGRTDILITVLGMDGTNVDLKSSRLDPDRCEMEEILALASVPCEQNLHQQDRQDVTLPRYS